MQPNKPGAERPYHTVWLALSHIVQKSEAELMITSFFGLLCLTPDLMHHFLYMWLHNTSPEQEIQITESNSSIVCVA